MIFNPSRIAIPLNGSESCALQTRTGIHVATGFARVVLGGRGPYVEFLPCHMNFDALHRPPVAHFYFEELRTDDGLMVYLQKRRVDYADYVQGRLYASPFELCTDDGLPCVDRVDPNQLSLFGGE